MTRGFYSGESGVGDTGVGDVAASVTKSTGPEFSTSFLLVTWDTEEYDTDAMHEAVTNPSRITVPDDGRYQITAQVGLLGGGTNPSAGAFTIMVRKNAAGVAADGTLVGYSSSPTNITASNVGGCAFHREADLNAADYVEVFCRATTTGNLSSTAAGSVFQVRRVA